MFGVRSKIRSANPVSMVQVHGRRTGAMSLATVESGRKVRISSISGGRGLRQRLCDLGLYEGATIEVVRNDISGPILLKVLDSRIVIGRGQAHKIMIDIVG